jgi:hypothetical protein
MADTLAQELTDDACAVCCRFVLIITLHSVGYVAGWGHPQGHDPEAFRVGISAIHCGAAYPIDAIEAAMTDAGELYLAA